jgi:hypothetical protein
MRDRDVRVATRQMLAALHDGDLNTRIVEEMGLWSGTVRIDVAVINGELSGYELKSDRDTLSRLPAQSALYSKIFDRLYLIVGSRHVSKAAALVPDWWGLTVATEVGGNIQMYSERQGRENPEVDPFLVAQLLWRSECINILASAGLARGWRSKPAAALQRHLASSIPLCQLRNNVRAALKARVNWLGQSISD